MTSEESAELRQWILPVMTSTSRDFSPIFNRVDPDPQHCLHYNHCYSTGYWIPYCLWLMPIQHKSLPPPLVVGIMPTVSPGSVKIRKLTGRGQKTKKCSSPSGSHKSFQIFTWSCIWPAAWDLNRVGRRHRAQPDRTGTRGPCSASLS